MKRFFISLLLLTTCFLLQAQEFPCDHLHTAVTLVDQLQDRSLHQDEIESRKIAYLATSITLTPVEAARFWPVYNEWNKKIDDNMRVRHAALRQIRQLSRSGSTDEKAYAQQNKILMDGAAEEARIVTDAHRAYVSILGTIRTAKLYLAEEQFRNMLIRELRQNQEDANRPK